MEKVIVELWKILNLTLKQFQMMHIIFVCVDVEREAAANRKSFNANTANNCLRERALVRNAK